MIPLWAGVFSSFRHGGVLDSFSRDGNMRTWEEGWSILEVEEK